MSNGDDTCTHKDIAQELGVSETTIKSYRRKFPRFFPLHSKGKPLRFKPEVMEVCREIRQGFLQDLSVEEIRTILDNKFKFIKSKRNQSSPTDTDSLTTYQAPEKQDEQRTTLQLLLQEQARTNQSLETLQSLIAELLERNIDRTEALSHSLLALQELFHQQLQRPVPQDSPPDRVDMPRDKRVVIRNIYGGRSEYHISSSPAHSAAGSPAQREASATEASETTSSLEQQSQTPPPAAAAPFEDDHTPQQAAPLHELRHEGPPQELLQHPLVVRSTAGEYLGIAGKSEGVFCLNDFKMLVQRSFEPPHNFGMEWKKGEEGLWSLHLEQEAAIRPLRYKLIVEQVSTPKGNDVTQLSGLEVGGADMPPANLYAFIREMKERLQKR